MNTEDIKATTLLIPASEFFAVVEQFGRTCSPISKKGLRWLIGRVGWNQDERARSIKRRARRKVHRSRK